MPKGCQSREGEEPTSVSVDLAGATTKTRIKQHLAFFPRRTKWISPISKTRTHRWREKERLLLAFVPTEQPTHQRGDRGPSTRAPGHPTLACAFLFYYLDFSVFLFCSVLF